MLKVLFSFTLFSLFLPTQGVHFDGMSTHVDGAEEGDVF